MPKLILNPMINLGQKLHINNYAIQVAASQISASAQQLTLTLGESHTFAHQLFKETQQIVQVNNNSQDSLAKAILTLKELIATLEKYDDISHQVRTVGSESEKNIGSGLSQIMEILRGVKQVEDATLETVSSINEFQKTSQTISEILGAVDNIANQTHLLAFNASIEAARAGEHGLGFGVVAHEIRTLADNSKKAVLEISNLIMKMTQEVTNVTDTICRNHNYVQNVVELSKSVEIGLNQISLSHEKVQDLMQGILQVAKQQYDYAINIGNQVEAVENSFQQVNNGFSDLSLAVAEQKKNLVDTEILTQNLLDAERGLSGLIASERNLINENQRELQEKAEHAFNILMTKTKDYKFDSNMQYRDLLDRVLLENSFMEAIWLNDRNGKFEYSNPPAQIANANVREWFKRAMNGEKYFSSVYISAITNAPCLTVSFPIRDSAGNIMGVIGADIKIAV
ncbi:MAG: methyl-accepting chemotaxis protein [Desulfosporosinus sp.]